jgi:serine protein kinase
MNIFSQFQTRYELRKQEEYTLEEYLEICKNDSNAYASAAERLLIAIGEPEFVDTSKDPRLSRIFSNKVIKRYEKFSDFYGMEECIEEIVSFFKHAAQGLEEKKQIIYLLGPVGGGKSSLAEKLKELMQLSKRPSRSQLAQWNMPLCVSVSSL